MSAYTDGLRALADLFDAHPDKTPPDWSSIVVNLFVDDGDAALALARSLGGNWEKQEYGDWLALRRTVGPHYIDIDVRRDQVCERVQVGTKTVEIPDPAAPTVTVEKPIYEWECPGSWRAVVSA